MNYCLPKKIYNFKGQMLLGILVSVGVFAILIHALFTLIASSYDLINFNRARITARHLAQEKIELTRNLPYLSIGTVGGIPLGILEQEENVIRNGLNFLVKTSVVYIDDPFDNTAPTDTRPEDYKRVRIEVSWEGLAASNKNPIILITDITPEQTTPGSGGTLTILVMGANGQPVSQASVHIAAASLVPPIDFTWQTNDDGEINIPGTPSCSTCYEITITKSDHSTDRTYSASEVTNPTKPHASVLDGQLTQLSFAIDTVGTINIVSKDSRANNFVAKGNVPFRLRGGKIIGTDSSGVPVYKYDNNLTTDDSGNFNITDAEWDSYYVLMPTLTSWDISGSLPLQPLSLVPGGDIDYEFSVDSHSDHSFLTVVKDPSQNLIASASARIYDGIGFDENIATGLAGDPDFGQALFSGLEERVYTIEATSSGYLDYSGNFDVSGYTSGEVVLTPM